MDNDIDDINDDEPGTRATEWPLETKHLAKGDRIPASIIEEVFKTSREKRNYGLKLMRACDFVTRRLLERGISAVVVSEHDDLVILTDAEAATYSAHNFDLGRRKMGRSLQRQAAVDRSQLTPDQLATHDRALAQHGAIYAATTKACRTFALPSPTQRNTPGLIVQRTAPKIIDENEA